MKEERDGMVSTEWDVVDLDFFYSVQDGVPENLIKKKQDWCLQYKGLGKFYIDEVFGLFYFERDEDRIMFLLRW